MKVPPFELPLEEIRASLQKLRRPLSVAVLRARNPFNVGAIIRVAHSFLVREILLVGDERFYERGAMGMDRYENIVLVPTEAEFIARVRAAGRQLLVFEKDAARVNLWHADLPDDCVMLFGSETAGVSPEIWKRLIRSSASRCTASTTRSRSPSPPASPWPNGPVVTTRRSRPLERRTPLGLAVTLRP